MWALLWLGTCTPKIVCSTQLRRSDTRVLRVSPAREAINPYTSCVLLFPSCAHSSLAPQHVPTVTQESKRRLSGGASSPLTPHPSSLTPIPERIAFDVQQSKRPAMHLIISKPPPPTPPSSPRRTNARSYASHEVSVVGNQAFFLPRLGACMASAKQSQALPPLKHGNGMG